MRNSVQGAQAEICPARPEGSGIRQVDAFRPELIILDLNLPGVDGFQICEKIRSDPAKKDIKILAITAYDKIDTKEQIFESGADEYLVKPFSLHKLLECVDNLS
jgi:DNA-binding response OmpR family regulator